MPPTPPKQVLAEALTFIRTFGWRYQYSVSSTGPCNIRSAVAKACTKLHGTDASADWYDSYTGAVNAITKHLDTGIQNWEYKSTQAQVEQMLAEAAL